MSEEGSKKEEFEKNREVRQKEMEEAKAKREEERDEDPEEEVGYIEEKIKNQLAQIRESMARTPELVHDKTLLQPHFDTMFELFKHLQDYLASIYFCLPSRTQQTFQNQVDEL